MKRDITLSLHILQFMIVLLFFIHSIYDPLCSITTSYLCDVMPVGNFCSGSEGRQRERRKKGEERVEE